ncbi:MAG: tRNA preQ1(34) S-adenosylmethionine ribosyltransferase-isomerase QueA [Acidimicrobiales bacterium]|jgi:S-adenosylmethionine:tRNA ribosyltransferase-isomerase|nr:tRNA preQ1(34) S-adenosylmethionine ribosyltransferase-isomerase QueA [Acidimicrobiales bacterium]
MAEPPSRIDDVDYALPPERIAQRPLEVRDASRLLVDLGDSVEHRTVRDLPSLLAPGDVVVVNDTRVLPARLHLHKPTGGAVEVLLLDPRDDGWWTALVKPSRKVAPGTELVVGDDLTIVVGEVLDGGRRAVRVVADGDWLDVLARHGEVPLPPYITERLDDPERYQTVFADRPASAAAPTAGLHLTERVLAELAAKGIPVVRLELVVGLDTFRPVTAEHLDDHVMHHERYRVPAATWEAVQQAERVVAIGTTAVRALESAAARGELEGSTDLFIRRPFDWQVVDLLLTNFHLPKSTLLLLIDAFVGPRWRTLYETALAEEYRFLSFGDAMLLRRREATA